MKRFLRRFIFPILLAGISLVPCPLNAHGFEAMVLQLQDDEVIAMVNEEPMSVGQLKMLISLRTAPYRQGNFLFFSLKDLLNAAQQAPTYTALAHQAQEQGITLTEDQQEELAQLVEHYTHRRLYNQHITKKIANPSMEMLQNIYEEVKEEKFRTSEKFIVREISIPYTDDDSREEAKKAVQNAWEDLEDGTPFLTVMDNYLPEDASKSARILIPDQDQSITQEMVDLYSSMGNRTYSKPMKANNSWKIYYLQLHLKAVYLPFESTIAQVTEIYEQKSREDKIYAFFEGMVKNPDLFRLQPSNLMNRGDLALASDVMMIAGDVPITRQDLMDSVGWYMSQDALHSESALKEIAPRIGPVQRALLNTIIDQENQTSDQMTEFYTKAARETYLTRNLLVPEITQNKITITQKEIYALHQEMEAFKSGKASIVHYETLSVYGNEIEPDQLKEMLKPVNSLESFRKVGDELYSQTNNATYGKKMQTLVQSAPKPIFKMLINEQYTGLSSISTEENKMTVYWVESSDPLIIPSEKETERLAKILSLNKIQDEIETNINEKSTENNIQSLVPTP